MTAFGGPWSRLKLDCVESYAVAYLKVMQQQNWSLHYVDAFAGQGRQQLKLVASHPDSQSENQASFDFLDQAEDEARLEFLEGSTLRALKVSDEATREFDRFIFIEASRKAKEKLAQHALVEWPTQAAKIELLKDDANGAIGSHVGGKA